MVTAGSPSSPYLIAGAETSRGDAVVRSAEEALAGGAMLSVYCTSLGVVGLRRSPWQRHVELDRPLRGDARERALGAADPKAKTRFDLCYGWPSRSCIRGDAPSKKPRGAMSCPSISMNDTFQMSPWSLMTVGSTLMIQNGVSLKGGFPSKG